MKPEDYTDITIVLDRSGSMSSVLGDTIEGFNSFLKKQKDVPGEATLSLLQFDHELEWVEEGTPLERVGFLDQEKYVPRGMTSLLDAIGIAINRTGDRLRRIPESERPSKVLMVILTDGIENNSKEFTNNRINQMISHQKNNYSWEFVFLGANQDAIASASKWGIGAQHSLSYGHNKVGTQNAFDSVTRVATKYRSTMDATFEDKDRKMQEEAGVFQDINSNRSEDANGEPSEEATTQQ